MNKEIEEIFEKIGVAIPHNKSYTYQIFEKRLDKYLNGDDF